MRRRSAGRVDRSPIRHVYDRVDVGIRWCDSLGASSPTQLSPSPTIHTSYIALSLHVFRDVDVALSLPLSLYCVYEVHKHTSSTFLPSLFFWALFWKENLQRKCRPFQTVSFLGIPCSAELILEFKVNVSCQNSVEISIFQLNSLGIMIICFFVFFRISNLRATEC